MSKRQSIKKADAETTEGGTHQLTDIQVHEVSVVDRAANKRRFITTKADETPAETAARIQAKIAARGDLTPGADADATIVATEKKDDDISGEVPSQIPIAHAHAASAHAAAATAHAAAAEASSGAKKTSKASVAPLPPPSGVAPAATAPVVETIADPEAELLALAKSSASEPVAASTEIVATKAAEIAVTTNEDGSVVIMVDDQPTTISNPSLPSAVQDKVKTSVVAGIDAIMLRMATLRQNVLNSKGSYSASGTPSELSDLYYICDMLYSLYSIGGPNWEIEQAADAALDASGVAKSVTKSADSIKVQKNKVINMARTLKLKAAHVAMAYAHKDMDNVLKELDTEGGDATGEMARGEASTPASTPSGVAPSNFAKAAKDIKEEPEYLSIVEELKKRDEELKKNAIAIASLQKLAANQGELIAKARGSVVTSNAAEQIPVVSAQEDVQWDLDLAAPSRPVSKSFGRDNERPRR